MSSSRSTKWHFDLDHHLNPFLLPSPLSRFPRWVSRFLGHRHSPQRPLGNIIVVLWAFIGVFAGLMVVEVVSRQIPIFREHGAPIIIGSFGAAAVLEFYAIESPLAQPRNTVCGQTLSSVIGVSICKLFSLSPAFSSPSTPYVRWLSGAISCATATAVMALTGTVHPPAGATALLAVVDDSVVRLGWLLVPDVVLGCTLMLIVALLVNNVQRRFPNYWWTPEEVGQFWQSGIEGIEASVGRTGSGGKSAESGSQDVEADVETLAHVEYVEGRELVISRRKVRVPEAMYITPEEAMLLESLSQRL